MGGHLETVDVKTQVLGLRAWITLQTVDVGPQIQGLGGGSPWGLGTCDPKCNVWGRG